MVDFDDATLDAELTAMVTEILSGPESESISVNVIRQRVETKLGLESGFFTAPEWKQRSKAVIREKHVCCCCCTQSPVAQTWGHA